MSHTVFCALLFLLGTLTITGDVPFAIDGNCRHVYIDMGTNRGHQIRKLYEPHLYPSNPIEPRFAHYFGSGNRFEEVCSFGFEANPVHSRVLQPLESAYLKLGGKVHILNPIAVGTRNSDNITFYRDANQRNEVGASLIPGVTQKGNNLQPVFIAAMDIAAWMKTHIVNRTIPDGNRQFPPAIVMKSDIEGMDTDILSHLLREQVLCNVSFIYGEHMTVEFVNATMEALRLEGCRTQIELLDDEFAPTDTMPLPTNISVSLAVHGVLAVHRVVEYMFLVMLVVAASLLWRVTQPHRLLKRFGYRGKPI